MVKKLVFMVVVFMVLLVYLHQKVAIYDEAYKLNDLYSCLNKLVETRDALLYNFSKKVSLAKINSWSDANGLTVAEGDKILAFDIGGSKEYLKKPKANIVALSLKRIFHMPGESKAMAQERR